jgi:DNA-directed RNA polymerase specialized sigma24 family protein
MVVLTGSSSKQSALVNRLSAALPTLLRRRTRKQSPRRRQAQRRLTTKQAQRLTAEYENGASMKELAKRWSLHRTTVAAQLRQAGIRLRRQGIPDALLDEVIQRYDEGWSCQQLAKHYECDAETVRQKLKRAGLTLRKPWDRRFSY